ncbi:MAG TPA: thiamine-phosphate kinase [Thiothrix sp.]|nr:thiamine-phosphate kinase [Thiothrix sp.]
MSSEFDLIQTYFNWHYPEKPPASFGLIKGIGDDGAVLQIPSKQQLIVTTDTLISGVHFPEQTPPHAIGHKSLAVNLSDLAAMGADPAWFTLALTLPHQDKQWLSDFSAGLKALADKAGIQLIGGDTTKGPLSISITAMGLAESKDLMMRSSAKDKDVIYVTHTLGDAAAGLAMLQQRFEGEDDHSCIEYLNYPTPRNDGSILIRCYANACVDISDGFLADLNHILQSSKVGAVIDLDTIPLPKALQDIDQQKALEYALTGGDDYELLFTVAQENQYAFEQLVQQEKRLECIAVGVIDSAINGIVSNQKEVLTPKGYNHFR